MKKVLFLLNNMNIGGTEKSFLNLLETLSPEEYDVTLLLLEATGGFMEYIPSWVHVKTVPEYVEMKPEIMSPPISVAKRYFREHKAWRAVRLLVGHLLYKLTGDRTPYFRIVEKGKPRLHEEYDVAIAYAGPFDFLTVYVLYDIQAKEKIQWVHFDVRKIYLNTKMCRKLYPQFDQINVVSDEARRALLEKIPEIAPKTKTVLNVVSAKQCQLLAERGNGFEDNYMGIRIVTVGRLSREKGQDIVPEVAARLKEYGVEFRWYLVGDGKLKPEIEQKCTEYGVSDDVVFLGTTPNPYPYLKQADLYVQTSVHEGFCITLAEAKVFGLPIISTDCAGAHEQLDGIDNCHVTQRQADDMCNAVLIEAARIKKIIS